MRFLNGSRTSNVHPLSMADCSCSEVCVWPHTLCFWLHVCRKKRIILAAGWRRPDAEITSPRNHRLSVTNMARKGSLLLLSALALTQPSWGQKASTWRVYNLADGLPESACVSVTAAQQGRVLVRHFWQPFISELDGYGINLVPAPENAIGRVYESP